MPLVYIEIQIDTATHVSKVDRARAPINQFVHYRAFPDASNRTVEPMVLSVPARHPCRWPPASRGISLRPPAGDASCTGSPTCSLGAGTLHLSESGAALSEGICSPSKALSQTRQRALDRNHTLAAERGTPLGPACPTLSVQTKWVF